MIFSIEHDCSLFDLISQTLTFLSAKNIRDYRNRIESVGIFIFAVVFGDFVYMLVFYVCIGLRWLFLIGFSMMHKVGFKESFVKPN